MSTGPRKVRLADVRRPDMTLVVLDDAGNEVEYTVRGQLTVDEMIAIMQLQQKMELTTDANPAEVMVAVQESSKLVTKLVKERHADAPDLNLGMEEVMMGFSALIGGTTAAAEFAATLTDGLSDEVIADAPEVAPDSDPTSRYATPSSSPSPPLVSVTGGTLTGGPTVAGEPSDFTSIEPTSA